MHDDQEPLFLLVMCALLLVAILVKTLSRRYLRVPPVVGYIGLGLVLRVADDHWALLPSEGVWTLDVLAQVGVAALLFHVGLKSDLKGLQRQLPRAARVWVSDVFFSSALSFGVALLAGLGLITSLFVAVALSATSVGVSIAVWEEAKQMKSHLGQLLLDVAELDDLSAILLMLLLITAAPMIHDKSDASSIAGTLAIGTGVLLAKLGAFAVGCWLFARHLEGRLTQWISKAEPAPDRVLTIVAVGFGLAALAGAIGFSVAVGALFAGLVFSRDPRAVREEASFTPIYALFTPFFFIDVGYALDPTLMRESILLGLLLFVPAVAGKALGAGFPIARASGWRVATVLGTSMVPRAEIALLVARTGNRLGPWAVSDEVYGALVCVAALASFSSPILLGSLLERWRHVVADEDD